MGDQLALFDVAAPKTLPLLKWAGGKRRLLPELRRRMPRLFSRYFEPFAGGAALFFDVRPQHAVIGDLNDGLVNCYRAVADELSGVIGELRRLASVDGEATFLAVRDRWNDRGTTWTPAERAAAFLYLNKTCFNGLWRVNRAGCFNVGWGKGRYVLDEARLAAASVALRRADIRHSGYRETVADARAGDFVYLDPPYDPVSTTANFAAYTSQRFGEPEQRELEATARELVQRGCHVMISNSDTPMIRDIYSVDTWRISQVMCSRSINCRANRRGAVTEVLVTGKRS